MVKVLTKRAFETYWWSDGEIGIQDFFDGPFNYFFIRWKYCLCSGFMSVLNGHNISDEDELFEISDEGSVNVELF